MKKWNIDKHELKWQWNNEVYHNILGKYTNGFETNAIHSIELKSDSSFIHYYKKDGDANQKQIKEPGNYSKVIIKKKWCLGLEFHSE